MSRCVQQHKENMCRRKAGDAADSMRAGHVRSLIGDEA